MEIGSIPIQEHVSKEIHLRKLRGNGWQFPSIGPDRRVFSTYCKLGAYAQCTSARRETPNERTEQKPGFKRLFKTSVGIYRRFDWVRFLAEWALISVVSSQGSLIIRHGFCLRLLSHIC
jgi:hypothetical protein